MDTGELADGLLHARRASELDPSDSGLRGLLCVALVANGSPLPETKTECETAQAQMEKDSLTNTSLYELVHKYAWTLQAGETPRIENSPQPTP